MEDEDDATMTTTTTSTSYETERERFQIELEFVQSLANPNYLNYLAQRGYFKNEIFLNYLKYLIYWKEPEYCKYIVYPQCLCLLEMLQHEQFLKQIVNAQCSKYIDEQMLLIWLNYKKKYDWIRVDPCRVPDNVEHLFKNANLISDQQPRQAEEEEEMHDEASVLDTGTTTTTKNNRIDPFSAFDFAQNEKF
jgi:mediator of RNA polymerase II transcription subunit 31